MPAGLTAETRRLTEEQKSHRVLEFREQRLLQDLNEKFLFCGLIKHVGSFPDSAKSPTLAAIDFVGVSFGLDRAAEFYGGVSVGMAALMKRITVLSRIDDRLKSVFITPAELSKAGVFGEIARNKSDEFAFWDSWNGNQTQWLALARKNIPDLEDRILHAYSLIYGFDSLPKGVDRLINGTVAFTTDKQQRIEMLELFKSTHGHIPTNTLETLKEAGVKDAEMYQTYGEIHFSVELNRLFSWAIARDDWKEAISLAELGRSTYALLSQDTVKTDDKYDQSKNIGKQSICGWIVDHSVILRADIAYLGCKIFPPTPTQSTASRF